MRLINAFLIAFRALRRNKMRSLLTALGIIIGVASVIAMTAIGNGAKEQVKQQIANLGQNVILVFSGSFNASGRRTGWGSAGSLKIEDAQAIAREIQQVVAVSPEVRVGSQVGAGNQNWYTTVYGESESYFDLRQWPVVDGAPFSDHDIRRSNKVAVLGSTVATQLFGDESPVGKTLRIRHVPFVVVGVLASKGLSMTGQDQDDVIIIPYTSAMTRLSRTTRFRSFLIQVDHEENLSVAQEQIVALLRQYHNIRPGREDDFTVRTQEEIAETAGSTARVMTTLIGAIASVSLLVGGIGIMNIMLVSVTERTREIGIRIAVGAHRSDIMLQFLIESITISSLGGIVGIILGAGGAQLLSNAKGWPMLVSAPSVLIAFCFSALVGVFFGFYPARKAANLDPIEALRYE